jgi:hypothetical protein
MEHTKDSLAKRTKKKINKELDNLTTISMDKWTERKIGIKIKSEAGNESNKMAT